MSTLPRVARDAGMQPERTTLAWQRAALAFLVLGLAAPRVGWPTVGAWALLPAGVVVAGSVGVLVAARLRYLRTFGTGPVDRSADGRLPLLAAALALTLGVLGACVVVLPLLSAG